MALEIERKFLVRHDEWRRLAFKTEELLDGLLARTPEAKVRVRISGESATLAIKSLEKGGVRKEYEYSINVSDAREMVEHLCGGNVLQKVRHHLDHEGFKWSIDEYEGILDGVIIAEVELGDMSITVPLPDWVGEEVTGNPAYKKINMLQARRSR